MAKTVFSNHMVAHVWAQQTQSEGRSHNGNFSFRDRVLYSYSTPIASFVTAPDGSRVCLLTSNTYSITTSGKHMGPTWRAIDYGRTIPVFRVPRVSAQWNDEAGMHKANLAHLVKVYNEHVAQNLRKRSCWHSHFANLAEYFEEKAKAAINYATTFELEVPTFDVQGDAQKAWDRFERLKNDPNRIKREAIKAAKEAAIIAKRIEQQREYRERWLSGEGVRAYFEGPTLLRVKGDNLETSQGASVPLSHAIRVFKFVRLCRERGEAWSRNGKTIRVGLFTVDHIAANGDFKAGCHSISWSECERIAKQLGIFDEALASDEALEPSTQAA